MTDKKTVRIFIVDDHPLVIDGLRNMVQNASGIALAGYATTATSCVDYFLKNDADVVLMDINLPDGNGVDLCAKIKELRPAIYILGLSTMNHPSTVRGMKENGASGYLLKSSSNAEIIAAIETVSVGGQLWDSAKSSVPETKWSAHLLTRREKEILILISNGFSSSEISLKISLSPSTVELHRKSLLSKFKARDNVDLIKIAKAHSLI